MKIEIVEFYPYYAKIKDIKEFGGTLHVYLIDYDIDLRGLEVFKTKKGWKFHFPSMKGVDQETKEEVRFPIFIFSSREKQKEMLDEVKRLCVEYIEAELAKKRWQ